MLHPALLGERWSPRSVPRCALWLDAADRDTITMGTGVSAWRDKSGNYRNALQGTGGSQPAYGSTLLNGRPVLTFDGSNDYLTIAGKGVAWLTTNSDKLWAGVMRATGAQYGGFLVASDTGQSKIGMTPGAWEFETNTYPASYMTPGISVGSWAYVTMGQLGSARNFARINGTEAASTSSSGDPSGDSGDAVIGNYRTSLTHYLAGEIAELIVFDNTMPGADLVERVERYLKFKWGF